MVDISNLGATATGVFSKVASGGLFFAKVLVSAGFFLMACFVFYKLFLEYRIQITLVKRVGVGALKWFTDKGKLIVDQEDNSRKLVLMRTRQGKTRLSTELPDSSFRGIKGKGDHYIFLIDDNNQLQPIRPLQKEDFEDSRLKLFPEDKRWWARKEDKRRLDKYVQKSNLEKWLPSIVVITAFVITFFIAYFGFTYLGNGMSALATSFNQVATSCTVLTG